MAEARTRRASARTSSRRERSRAQRAEAREERVSLRERLQGGADGLADVARSHPRTSFVLVLVLVALLMLYGPTRDYYVAMRSGQDLQAYYEAISAQNESLRDDLDRLQSQEGIEDEAHRRGYVSEGETGVVVDNLEKEDVTALLGDVEVEDTRPWYVRLLDVVFRYSEDSWQ